MLPRSSPRVAELVKISNQIAREYDQEYVGTEHLLLAIPRQTAFLLLNEPQVACVDYDTR